MEIFFLFLSTRQDFLMELSKSTFIVVNRRNGTFNDPSMKKTVLQIYCNLIFFAILFFL